VSLYSCKYRLKPTPEQEVLLNKHFGCVRYIYNHFLRQRIDLYEQDNETQNYYDNATQIPSLKKELPWLKEIGSQALQYAVKQLQTGYDNFFRKVKQKTKGKKGFPKFKGKFGKQSFKVMQNVKIIDGKLVIPKFLKGINIVQHRELEGEIKFATVSKNKSGQYFVSITTEYKIEKLPKGTKTVGYDLNVKYVVGSDGSKESNPLPETKNKQYLKFLAKELSRKQKGSKERKKAQLRLNKWKLYCKNVHEDFLHKLSSKIINENQVIVIEDLDVNGMLANKQEKRKFARWKERKLHKQLQDCGFSSLIQKLTYKAGWYGRELIKVSRWFPSSQLCSECNYQNKELGEEKEWACWNCFANHDRDENASVNIHNEGIRTLGTRGIAYCPDVRPILNGLLVG
jgi:putative transposase